VSQVSRFSVLLAKHGFIVETWDMTLDLYDDTDYLIACFKMIYNSLGLPTDGAKPGYAVFNPEENAYEILDLWVPPLTPELFLEGWVSACYWRFQGEDVEVGWTSAPMPPPLEIFAGMTFFATGNFHELALLEALGDLRSKILKKMVRFDTAYFKYLKGLLDRPHTSYEVFLYEFTVVEVNPHWYDLIHRYYPSIDGHDILDNMTVVESLFSEE
jgi:hypothetical protein